MTTRRSAFLMLGSVALCLACAALMLPTSPAQAQDPGPVSGALATLAAATAQAQAVRAAQQATAAALSAEGTRQAIIAQATARALSAAATQSALDELNRRRAATATAQALNLAATASAQQAAATVQAGQVAATATARAQSAAATQSVLDELNRQRAAIATAQALNLAATASAQQAAATVQAGQVAATASVQALAIAQQGQLARTNATRQAIFTFGLLLVAVAAGMGALWVLWQLAKQGGLAYVPKLKPRPRVKLPDVARLDLAAKPAGDLPVPVGIGRDGASWRELRDLGHSLIVGTSGSGKSTFVHSALAGLLSVVGPDRVRLALIDPKRSEFMAWAGVPHLMAGIAHTPSQAADLLRELAAEVDTRGDKLAAEKVRDIGTYNRKTAQPLPYVLAVIDECLDLADERGVTESLKAIARQGRSAGVILWTATQHGAAVEGLPRVVNVNLTTRFVFRVADRSAADVAGAPGAESLPRDKPGRMLAKIDGALQEMQSFTVGDDQDLADVVRAIMGEAATPKASAPTAGQRTK